MGNHNIDKVPLWEKSNDLLLGPGMLYCLGYKGSFPKGAFTMGKALKIGVVKT